MRYILSIILLAGILSSCKTNEKGFPLFSVSQAEKEIIADADYIEAISQKNNGNYEKAIALLKSIIKDTKYPASAHFELSKIYQIQKKYTEALTESTTTIQLEPTNKWYLEHHIILTKLLGKHEETTATFKLRQKHFPKNTEFKIEFSDFYIQTKQFKKALDLYEEIEDQIGVNETINFNKFLIYNELEEFEKAEKELNKLIKAFPTSTEFYIQYASYLLQADRVEDALGLYDLALEYSPNDPYIIAEQANYFYASGKKDTALSMYEGVIADPSYETKDRVSILQRFMRIGEVDEVVYKQTAVYLELATQVDPNSPSVNTLAADYFFRDQKYIKAKTYYKTILELKPNSFLIWRQLLMCDYNLKEFDSMRSTAMESLELFPTQSELYLYAGLASIQLKSYEEALQFLEEGLTLAMDDRQLKAQFYSNLADLYYILKNYEKSDEYFDITLADDPNNSYVLNNYAYYLSERNVQLEKAQAMSKKSNELLPNESSFEDTYGWILYQLKDYNNALLWLKKSETHGGSSSAVINEHLGDVHFRLGNIIEAVNYWENAKFLGETSEKLLKKIKLRKIVD